MTRREFMFGSMSVTTLGLAAGMGSAAEGAAESGPLFAAGYAEHLARASKWYLPGRIGVFYHWGLFTGGGCSHPDPKIGRPLAYPTPADFEKAAPDPAAVARNFVESAKAFGATYVILTLWHVCAGHMVLYPTKVPEFYTKTTIDYVGPFLDECRRAGIHPMLYFPSDAPNWNYNPKGPSIDPKIGPYGNRYFVDFSNRAMTELKERYGGRIDGFWIDGFFRGQTPKMLDKIRELFPKALIVGNCMTDFRVDCDVATTMSCSMISHARPNYNRPDAFRKFGCMNGALPQRDLHEDDIGIGGWSYTGEEAGEKCPFVKDPRLFVRQVISSLGQRGRWNVAIAFGPRIDGTMPLFVRPIAAKFREFLAWAGPAIYRTRGPADSFFDPGYTLGWNAGASAFYSVTRSLDNPSVFYALITGVENPNKRKIAYFQTNGRRPRRVSDLRTGREYPFETPYATLVRDLDLVDVDTYGATVLKFEF